MTGDLARFCAVTGLVLFVLQVAWTEYHHAKGKR